MSLLLHELLHISISLCIGYFVWRKSKKFLLSIIAAILGGVFVDLDHLIDYFISFGINFNLNYFLKGYQFLKNDKIFIPLHAWELVLILALLYTVLIKHRFKFSKFILAFFLAFTLGLTSHLFIDTFTNELIFPGYSVVYRILNRFEVEKLVKRDHYRIHILEKNKLFP